MARPEGVQIRRGDGTVIDCELVHEGVDERGMDRWMIAGVEFHPEHGDQVYVQEIPPRTSLSVFGHLDCPPEGGHTLPESP
jgi:hypothetical protein